MTPIAPDNRASAVFGIVFNSWKRLGQEVARRPPRRKDPCTRNFPLRTLSMTLTPSPRHFQRQLTKRLLIAKATALTNNLPTMSSFRRTTWDRRKPLALVPAAPRAHRHPRRTSHRDVALPPHRRRDHRPRHGIHGLPRHVRHREQHTCLTVPRPLPRGRVLVVQAT